VKVFSWRTRVYWEDTDAGGVVYYANYLRFMERARTEWLRTLGYCQRDLASRHGVLFAVTRVRIDYRRPARLDDELSVTCEPRNVGAASVSFAQAITRISTAAAAADAAEAPGVLTEAEVRIACLDARSFRPLRMPEFLLSAFAAQEKL
jgi:acyl-CoA thioester hydrolase